MYLVPLMAALWMAIHRLCCDQPDAWVVEGPNSDNFLHITMQRQHTLPYRYWLATQFTFSPRNDVMVWATLITGVRSDQRNLQALDLRWHGDDAVRLSGWLSVRAGWLSDTLLLQ
jgi:hypothetical protein